MSPGDWRGAAKTLSTPKSMEAFIEEVSEGQVAEFRSFMATRVNPILRELVEQIYLKKPEDVTSFMISHLKSVQNVPFDGDCGPIEALKKENLRLKADLAECRELLQSLQADPEEKVQAFTAQAGGHQGTAEIEFFVPAPGQVAKKVNPDLPQGEDKFYQMLKDYPKLALHCPRFFGMKEHQKKHFFVMEDLTFGYDKPVILDIKMGTQTYSPDAPEDKKEREIAKAKASTLHSLGFRCVAMKRWDAASEAYVSYGKEWGKSVTEETVLESIEMFFKGRPEVIRAFLDKLEEQLQFMESQHDFQFFASSLLFVYDATAADPQPRLKMIDFAHVYPIETADGVDEGYVFGLRNLIAKFEELLKLAAASTEASAPKVQAFANQAGGHQDEAGPPSFMVPEPGKVAKRMGKHPESGFYKRLEDLPVLAEWCPKFYGEMEHMGANYAVVDDLTFGFVKPSLLDIKMGTQTYAPDASPEKIEAETAKANSSTLANLGFRCVAQKRWDAGTGEFVSKGKDWGKNVKEEDLQMEFGAFFDAKTERGRTVLTAFLAKLREVLAMQENQHDVQMFASSLLFVYEGDISVSPPKVQLKMIDFAHVYPIEAADGVDEGYVFGLRNLIAKFEELLKAATE